MNCRVVSDFGAGPIFRGANWILRMIRRTEFLWDKKRSPPVFLAGTCQYSLLGGHFGHLWGRHSVSNQRMQAAACS